MSKKIWHSILCFPDVPGVWKAAVGAAIRIPCCHRIAPDVFKAFASPQHYFLCRKVVVNYRVGAAGNGSDEELAGKGGDRFEAAFYPGWGSMVAGIFMAWLVFGHVLG